MNGKKVIGTGGELLMHQLVAQGVDYAFTNTGSAEAGFFDAFLTVPGVQPILLLNESLVLSAADGYARTCRKAAFVNVHLAAGTRQGSGQLFNAYFDGTPMVVTAAMRDNGSFGDHNTLGVSSGFAQMSTVQDVTKKRWEIREAAGIPMATRRAFSEALTMPTGPVYMAFSGEALDAKQVEAVIQPAGALNVPASPDQGTLQQIHDALLNSERPLLVVGPDVQHASAQQEILDLAENYGLPVAVGFFDYGSFPRAHPSFVGMVDALPADDYDVVCCVGYRPNTRANATDERFPSAFKIGIGQDPSMLNGSFALDVNLWANVKQTLAALNNQWNPADANLHHISSRKADLAAKSDVRLSKQNASALAHANDNPIHPNYLGHRMSAMLAENSTIVSENFTAADHLMPFGFAQDDWRLVRTYGGSLGHGVGGAVGAQLADPARPLVLSIGDGSVMYSSSGFWTMARYSLPILTVVWNNMNYQTVRTNFARWGGNMAEMNKYPETFLGDPAIDFVMLAKAQGIEGQHVHEPSELDKALKRGREVQAAGEPYLLDVHITNVGAGADQSWHKAFSLNTL
ncbi:MAG TPA: thiamine pyrophosphate-binding protein [Gammaproteobacteria bacterium]|nr:thiamine pyrophosphate-binding protein [Gammaproteobacteria bacterium]HIK68427.1 thiamine pyrophosphate-binding protein [Pseudomonadales bacterium]